MRYASTDLLSRLGAEYVIGTLRGPARRRFERLLRSNIEAQRQVEFWGGYFGGRDCATTPISPPAESRRELLQAVRQTSSIRDRFRAGNFLAGLATAAAIAAAVWLGERWQSNGALLHRGRQTIQADADSNVPIYLTQVGIPSSSMQWLVSLSADHRHLIVVAGSDFLQIGRHTVELWCVEGPDKSPVALGLLPMERDGTVSFDVPTAARGQRQISFVISLEPGHGAQTAHPQGPVLDTEQALDLL
jgi:anti-sigma-K factor RskA